MADYDRRDRHRRRQTYGRREERPRRSEYDRKLRQAERDDDQSTKRTVCVTNLDMRVTEDELRSLLKVIGDIEAVSFVRDRNSGKSKGIAYVQFVHDWTVNTAVKQSGMLTLKGQPVHIAIPDIAHQPTSMTARRQKAIVLVVTKLPADMSQRDIRELFRKFGMVDYVDMKGYDARTGDGSVLVRFARFDEGSAAVSFWKTHKLLEKTISVRPASEVSRIESADPAISLMDAVARLQGESGEREAESVTGGVRMTNLMRSQLSLAWGDEEEGPMAAALKGAQAFVAKGRQMSRQEKFEQYSRGTA
ncbi:RNA recognition motif [Carpediemonas membranifera]|uniref:RNA recognition motif n=1 Tax=Carpediemonas membranifera TaxID=201153 RepID=A0A8J6ASD3_9EUKA|nr:RNA recognition motif [Carpediemonas membranifera]|eukprot:KAG9390285.1 RNA recognition motif [Carpediemonas membranifera]